MFELRRAGQADLEALLRLERACFAKPWSREQLQSLLAAYPNPEISEEFAYLAFDADYACGYCGWQKVLDEATLLSIAVLPSYRRQGLAERLFAQGQNLLLKAGVRRLLLEVSVRNEAALALYEKLGFHYDGRVKNYYGVGDDAKLMSKNLV